MKKWTNYLARISFCIALLTAGRGMAQTYFVEGAAVVGARFPAFVHAFGDYDNDGRADVFVSGEVFSPRLSLLHNDGDGRFTERGAAIGAGFSSTWKGGAVFGDYDNDGDLDIFIPVGQESRAGRNALLRNDRGVFVEVGEEAGLTQVGISRKAIWLDYDRDGNLDLYVTNASPNVLYRNNGDGTFGDVTETAGLQELRSGTEPFMFGGAVAGDFDDDGWPDLYLGFYQEANRLFLNDGQGGFAEVETEAFSGSDKIGSGSFAGDLDGDGDLDLYQANFGGKAVVWRNGGDGRSWEVAQTWNQGDYYGAGLADVDNDGDLDLHLLGLQHFLFLNDGAGAFEEQSAPAGIEDLGIGLAFADYDLDGFVDAWFGGGQDFVRSGRPYRNRGNDNHWLQVELVGIESNRSGIGARLLATAGDRRLRQDIFGGTGAAQGEAVAHFGLGEREGVERLQIRWPSGRVDELTDLRADQRIRIFEGRESFHIAEPSTWDNDIPDAVSTGVAFQATATVRPALFEANAEIVRVAADLSAFGGPKAVPLSDKGDGTYQLDAVVVEVEGTPGLRSICILIEQTTSLGPHWIRLSKGIEVLPSDLPILDDVLSAVWQIENKGGAEEPRFSAAGPVFRGDQSVALQVSPASFVGWSVDFAPAAPIDPFGYFLRFAFHPGDATGPRRPQLNVFVNTSKPVRLIDGELDGIGVDLEKREWQGVEIPFDAFELAFGQTDRIESIRIDGNLEGTFYLDDLGLFTHAPPPPSTAVLEEYAATVPQSFALAQNYPNPFNSATVIRFALPTGGEVELALYNLAGQKVATLVRGRREAGVYTVQWDGRGEGGRELASGIYLYSLRAGARVEGRKLLLLQ